MTTTLQTLPDQVRKHVLKMRELVHTIENAPLKEVVIAIDNLKTELDGLLTDASQASGRRA